MESFFLSGKNQQTPAGTIQLAEGETKILAIKKPGPGGNDVSIYCPDTRVADYDYVLKLQDPTKHSLNNVYDTKKIPTQAAEENGFVFVQIVGLRAGATEVRARYNTLEYKPYASPVSIVVTKSTKRLAFSPPVPFWELWVNHPYIKGSIWGDDGEKLEVCKKGGENQCMMRFCETLHRCDVSLAGLHGPRCGRGKGHEHHFSNPYEFENWKHLKDAYVWKVEKPLQVEPMPGLAARRFLRNRFRGVIVFYKYYDRGAHGPVKTGDMFGGHIDLYNGIQIGNNLLDKHEPDSAFLRAEKIAFWPLETIGP